MSNPIQIPKRKLASSCPPQPYDGPPMKSPPFFSPSSISSSFDEYCGHMKDAESFRQYWKKNVFDYKNTKEKHPSNSQFETTTNLKAER